jgi:hypothetical protein
MLLGMPLPQLTILEVACPELAALPPPCCGRTRPRGVEMLLLGDVPRAIYK